MTSNLPLLRVVLRLPRTVCWVVALNACTDVFLPAAPNDAQLLDGTIDGLTSEQRVGHASGDAEFARVFTPATGLGPRFVSASCESCHVGEGKGHPAFNLTRFGRWNGSVFDPMRSAGGPQLQPRAIAGVFGETLPTSAIAIAHFAPPLVTGLGLLEAVDDHTLLALADPDDRDGDGISGRPQWVAPTDDVERIVGRESPAVLLTRHVRHVEGYLGRFGRKASTVTLQQQVVTAYLQDMGITSDLLPDELIDPATGAAARDEAPDPEVGSSVVNSVAFYLRTLRPPPRRDAATPAVVAGEQLFRETGCTACHVASLRTGASSLAPLNRVTLAAYTDLLLHDMGPELDDGYTEGVARSSEWRTTPLWGLGLADRAQGRAPSYLHDGRAPTLRDAIRLHGGEAAASRSRFSALAAGAQESLLAFLRSL